MRSAKRWPTTIDNTRLRPIRTAINIVELLVALAVIAMLFLILLPALQRVRDAARNTQCISNMHQIGVDGFAGSGQLYMFCPADSARQSRQLADGTSYALNEDMMGAKNVPLSKTIRGFEAADEFRKKGVSPTDWFSGGRDKVWKRLKAQIAPQRHSNLHANYLYADGHVISIPVDQIQSWVSEGVNFGRPGYGGYQP